MPIINRKALNDPKRRKQIDKIVQTIKDPRRQKRFKGQLHDEHYWSVNGSSLETVDHAFGQKLIPELNKLNSKCGETASALDVGCGSAKALFESARHFEHIVFSGVSREGYLRWMQEEFPENLNLNHTNQKTFLKYLERTKKEFDLIFTHWGVKGDAIEKLNYIRSYARRLKKGGKFFISPSIYYSEWDIFLGDSFEISTRNTETTAGKNRFLVIKRVK